jgi:predicted RNase H-like HicB family nuclease
MKLKIVLEKGLDGYIIAYCPALKGCVTQGKTEEEAIANLKEAVELWLEPDPRIFEKTTDLYKICEVAV